VAPVVRAPAWIYVFSFIYEDDHIVAKKDSAKSMQLFIIILAQ
jgi:hypothetical protein